MDKIRKHVEAIAGQNRRNAHHKTGQTTGTEKGETMEFTPKEWYKDLLRSGLTIRYDDTMRGIHPVILVDERGLAEVKTEVGIERATANARLIAAAPDLLAALESICKIGGSAPGAPDSRLAECRRIARAAIRNIGGTT